jgi:hypothetical protein
VVGLDNSYIVWYRYYMTKTEFGLAVKIAQSDRDLSNVDDSILYGCGLPDYKPVYVTIEMVAKLIQWQCCGIFCCHTIVDSEELNNLAYIARRKFLIV